MYMSLALLEVKCKMLTLFVVLTELVLTAFLLCLNISVYSLSAPNPQPAGARQGGSGPIHPRWSLCYKYTLLAADIQQRSRSKAGFMEACHDIAPILNIVRYY